MIECRELFLHSPSSTQVRTPPGRNNTRSRLIKERNRPLSKEASERQPDPMERKRLQLSPSTETGTTTSPKTWGS